MSEEKKEDVQEEKGDALFDEGKEESTPKEKKSKAVGPVAPKGALAKQYAPAPGTEDIQAEDTTFPRFRLLQGTSSEVESGDAKSGVIKHSMSEETADSVLVIPLCLIRTRVMFNPDDRKGAPICRSMDTLHGTSCDCGCDNNCKACTYGRWEKGVPPVCSLVYNYPCLTPEQIGKEALPTLLSFMKSSTQSALKINTSVKWAIPPIPFWNFVWEIAAAQKKFKKGSAYVFDVKKVRETTPEEREWANNVYQHCVAGKRVDIDYEQDTE